MQPHTKKQCNLTYKHPYKQNLLNISKHSPHDLLPFGCTTHLDLQDLILCASKVYLNINGHCTSASFLYVHLTNIITRNYNKSTTINENGLNCTYHLFCQTKVITTSIPVIRLGSTIGTVSHRLCLEFSRSPVMT
jgi:hypothetical protein